VTLPRIAERLPKGEKGIARIEHRTPDKFSVMRAVMHGELLSQRPLATLFVRGCMVMSDGDMEWRSNSEFIYQAHGNVLIAGLGIGMVLAAILDKLKVRSVTVVEKYQDVIDLVAPHYASPKLTVICADIFDWKPLKGTLYETIYFDIWAEICEDHLAPMGKLHRRFARCLNRADASCWMGSWSQTELGRRR